jgi:hypothetical protein
MSRASSSRTAWNLNTPPYTVCRHALPYRLWVGRSPNRRCPSCHGSGGMDWPRRSSIASTKSVPGSRFSLARVARGIARGSIISSTRQNGTIRSQSPSPDPMS